MANTASQETAKQFVRLAVHKCGGGIQAEELTNIHASELSRWGNLDGSLHIPFYRMIELDAAADHASPEFLSSAVRQALARGKSADRRPPPQSNGL